MLRHPKSILPLHMRNHGQNRNSYLRGRRPELLHRLLLRINAGMMMLARR
jgi:hypothetical protein